ncbi:MAG: transcription elongation factor NusA [Mycoplasmataceae bacterium RV_VA103A]|nr:MAG: transcription elongation factor NusA [Mycoplasmataceae bacterium RV_VA103A]
MTENNNTQQFIRQLAEREGVSEEKIKEIIMDSFRKSYCKGENAGAELHFEFDSRLSVCRHYKIVDKLNDPEKEIASDNKLLKEGTIKDDNFLLPLDIENLSLAVNQEIEDRLRKDVGEIGWEKRQYKLYKSQEGEIIKGSIKSLRDKKHENYYAVDLGKGIGHWAKSEWVLQEKPRLGQRFLLLIKQVKEKSSEDTPQIILTRADDLFIRKLLEQEIPQLKEGLIVIHSILRLPGLISKVIVEKGPVAKEESLHIGPAGTCIGEGGEKAKSVSRLIYPERIDFADWAADKKKLLSKLISPVRLVKLNIKKETEWEIVVLKQKASLLLQHEGKMLQKISEFLGIKVHVRIMEEMDEEEISENRGKISQEVGNYKNIDVRIVEEIE